MRCETGFSHSDVCMSGDCWNFEVGMKFKRYLVTLTKLMLTSKPLWLVLLLRTHTLLLCLVGLVKIGECYSLKTKHFL